MGSLKRKLNAPVEQQHRFTEKNVTSHSQPRNRAATSQAAPDASSSDEGSSNGFDGFSESETPATEEEPPQKLVRRKPLQPSTQQAPRELDSIQKSNIPNGDTSREAHARQRALAKERKASKPNADPIARSKKIWEKLRRKSHISREERKTLVAELFAIITGHVKDFVFKHDAVRAIQTAVKYANLDQRHIIARELKGEYRTLAEGKYSKFLIGKLLVHGDEEIRDTIVPEFYGHIKRLIRHPEASWIVDDVYRSVATKQQKGNMLREWFGPEFTLLGHSDSNADLATILKERPEKRAPIIRHLKEMTNQFVQRKTSGFTMLHDAMLQYYLNVPSGSVEANEFIDMLKDDEDGDCYKNLAFTPSGSRLVCLLLATTDAKNRKSILRAFKGVFKMLSGDRFGHRVSLAAYETIDDTVSTAKSVFSELLCKDTEPETRHKELLGQAIDLTGRVPLLYLFKAVKPKSLLLPGDHEIIKEVQERRSLTSKKDPDQRRKELVKSISGPLLDLISAEARELISNSFGCHFVIETLLGADGDKTAALTMIADLAKTEPDLFDGPHAGRMLKALVSGGHWNAQTKSVDLVEPPLRFGDFLFTSIKKDIVSWARGPNSLILLSMLESKHFEKREELMLLLRENQAKLAERDGNDRRAHERLLAEIES